MLDLQGVPTLEQAASPLRSPPGGPLRRRLRPDRFRRLDGRKTIIAPDGSRLAPDCGKATDRTLVKALARVWRQQKPLDDGVYGSIAEMTDKEGINRSYLSRTIRLSLQAPDIVEAILSGAQPATLQLADLEVPFAGAAFGFKARRE
jgi:hypothetical protein